MRETRSNRQQRNPRALSVGGQEGFTLLELLVVIAILAGTAFIASGSFWHVREKSEEALVRPEMQEIARALRQFRQDTGYFPKEGPFALDLDTSIGGKVGEDGLPSQVRDLYSTNPDALRRWFYSPANFYQLLTSVSPLAGGGTDHPLAEWDPEAGRGWRGPYLGGFRDGYVDIGDDINRDLNDTSLPDGQKADNVIGDPTAVDNSAIPDVNGLADPFVYKPVAGGGSGVDDTLLDWNLLHRPADMSDAEEVKKWEAGKRGQWGRPYLLLRVDSKTQCVSDNEDCKEACVNLRDNQCGSDNICWYLVSMGPDGKYWAFDDKCSDNDDIILQVDRSPNPNP